MNEFSSPVCSSDSTLRLEELVVRFHYDLPQITKLLPLITEDVSAVIDDFPISPFVCTLLERQAVMS